MAKSSKTADLLKVLGAKAPNLERPSGTPAPEVPLKTPETSPPSRKTRQATTRAPAPENPPPGLIRGKAVQFYLHDEDQKLIRELAVWLAPHRRRINDSLIIKMALRAAKTGPDLLAAYDAAVEVDGRTRKNRRSIDNT
jgi:hypothetical protein